MRRNRHALSATHLPDSWRLLSQGPVIWQIHNDTATGRIKVYVHRARVVPANSRRISSWQHRIGALENAFASIVTNMDAWIEFFVCRTCISWHVRMPLCLIIANEEVSNTRQLVHWLHRHTMISAIELHAHHGRRPGRFLAVQAI